MTTQCGCGCVNGAQFRRWNHRVQVEAKTCSHAVLVNQREWKLDGTSLVIAECAACRSTVRVEP